MDIYFSLKAITAVIRMEPGLLDHQVATLAT